MSMAQANWTPRNLRKNKRSITSGKDKNENCKTRVIIAGKTKKYWATRSRAYKEAGYSMWCAKMDLVNGHKRAA